MPRKGPAPRRPLVSDPVFSSPLVTQLVNKVLKDGKRSLAEALAALDSTCADPVVTLKRALDNVKPALEVRSRRVGGATYQVPVEVRAVRADHARSALAGVLRLASAARRPWSSGSMNELLDASNGLGAAVKRREDMHKMAESNKAFAHYRW